MTGIIQHKGYQLAGELRDFSQAEYETYHRVMRELVRKEDTAANTNGAVVRAAVKAGFLTLDGNPDVGTLSPGAVVWLLEKVHNHVTAITTPLKEDDPN